MARVENAECRGHTLMNKTPENVNCLKEIVFENRGITIHEVANMLGISFVSVQKTLTGNMNMHPIATKFIPCLLSEEQKKNHVSMWLYLEERPEKNPKFLLKVMTGDKM